MAETGEYQTNTFSPAQAVHEKEHKRSMHLVRMSSQTALEDELSELKNALGMAMPKALPEKKEEDLHFKQAFQRATLSLASSESEEEPEMPEPEKAEEQSFLESAFGFFGFGGRRNSKENMPPKSTGKVFGIELDVLIGRDREMGRTTAQPNVPWVLERMIDRLYETGAEEVEGIFRIPGNSDIINQERALLDKEDPKAFACADPKVYASLLKMWLRQLPEPLIPTSLYQKSIATADQITERQSNSAVDIFELVKDPGHSTCSAIIQCLQRFCLDSRTVAKTRMNSENLSVCFAPCLLRNDRRQDDPILAADAANKEKVFVNSLIRGLAPEMNTTPTTLTTSPSSELLTDTMREDSSTEEPSPIIPKRTPTQFVEQAVVTKLETAKVARHEQPPSEVYNGNLQVRKRTKPKFEKGHTPRFAKSTHSKRTDVEKPPDQPPAAQPARDKRGGGTFSRFRLNGVRRNQATNESTVVLKPARLARLKNEPKEPKDSKTKTITQNPPPIAGSGSALTRRPAPTNKLAAPTRPTTNTAASHSSKTRPTPATVSAKTRPNPRRTSAPQPAPNTRPTAGVSSRPVRRPQRPENPTPPLATRQINRATSGISRSSSGKSDSSTLKQIAPQRSRSDLGDTVLKKTKSVTFDSGAPTVAKRASDATSVDRRISGASDSPGLTKLSSSDAVSSDEEVFALVSKAQSIRRETSGRQATPTNTRSMGALAAAAAAEDAQMSEDSDTEHIARTLRLVTDPGGEGKPHELPLVMETVSGEEEELLDLSDQVSLIVS